MPFLALIAGPLGRFALSLGGALVTSLCTTAATRAVFSSTEPTTVDPDGRPCSPMEASRNILFGMNDKSFSDNASQEGMDMFLQAATALTNATKHMSRDEGMAFCYHLWVNREKLQLNMALKAAVKCHARILASYHSVFNPDTEAQVTDLLETLMRSIEADFSAATKIIDPDFTLDETTVQAFMTYLEGNGLSLSSTALRSMFIDPSGAASLHLIYMCEDMKIDLKQKAGQSVHVSDLLYCYVTGRTSANITIVPEFSSADHSAPDSPEEIIYAASTSPLRELSRSLIKLVEDYMLTLAKRGVTKAGDAVFSFIIRTFG